jgi:uncharacterized DUF497 family protein
MHALHMKYEWSSEKNEKLKKERNISFEQILFHLSEGDVWKTADHPNQEDDSGQKIYFVIVDGYIYLVSFVVDDGYIFLKTIIPSRKATKYYQE